MGSAAFTAWNPGLETEIPKSSRTLETIYHLDNVYATYDDIDELCQATGLNPKELINFRPNRLAMHELIIRICANILVMEGKNEEDLGINFRNIYDTIFTQYIVPEIENIDASCHTMANKIQNMISDKLENIFSMPVSEASKHSFYKFFKIFKRTSVSTPPLQTPYEREFELINSLKNKKGESEIERAIYRSLYRVLGSILNHRGFIGNDTKFLTKVCSIHTCNYLGSRLVGRKVASLIEQAITNEAYRLIPDAKKPILISLKGASAAGKSYLRPVLRKKMLELGIESDGYGTISPDIWRRILLDYDSLGDVIKYAGRFTSNEVFMIDRKLDSYIRRKAKTNNSIPHLIVDRFRFDSFASDKIRHLLHKTYVQYFHTVYMYFVVTPPEATVERGWERGIERGRYKAVEDFLAHCIEAYAGMPRLLFKWISHDKPNYFFEFLDNSVAKGCYPEMIAKGTQSYMAIYKPEGLINIERYQRINVMAKTAGEVYPKSEELSVEKNLGFLHQCIENIQSIDFIDPETETCFLSIKDGTLTVTNEAIFETRKVDIIFSELLNTYPVTK